MKHSLLAIALFGSLSFILPAAAQLYASSSSVSSGSRMSLYGGSSSSYSYSSSSARKLPSKLPSTGFGGAA